MNPIFGAALEIQKFCNDQSWPFCVIGGLAVQRWGEPRLTRDVDLSLLTGFGSEALYVDQLLESFSARIGTARDFALQNRVLLLTATNKVPLDVSLAAMPFEERAIKRSSDYPIGQSQSLRTCSAEDLVVLKAFAARPRDWIDIEGVATRQPNLDRELIWEELIPLLELKEEPSIEPRLRSILD